MKRAFQLLLIVLLLLPVSVSAQRFKYNYKGVDFLCRIKDGKAEICYFYQKTSQLVVPAKVTDKDGKTWHVYNVGFNNWNSNFILFKTTTVVVLEPGIKVIDEYCFHFFKNLSHVYIPNTIERIGKNAFNNKNIAFTMPNTIKKSDLTAGLAVNLNTVDNRTHEIAETINLEDYIAETPVPDLSKGSNHQPAIQQKEAVPTVISDVDSNIPSSGRKRENTFCLVIGNENYQERDTPNVKYAMQDSKTFRDYCARTLGIPNENIKFISDARYLQFKEGLRWFKQITTAFGRDVNLIFYYAGHGIPNEKGHCHLLPTDVSINDAENAYSLKDLYTSLANMTSNNVLLLIDACFSGNDRGGDVAIDDRHRGVIIEVPEDNVPDNVIVMTATSQKETALAYDEKGHGFFTYFLLKKLQETRGKVTYGDLYEYVRREVLRKSSVIEEKLQTPSVTTSSSMAEAWKSLTF